MKKTLLFICFSLSVFEAGLPKNYSPVFFCFETKDGREFAVIRTFTEENKSMQMMIDTDTLTAYIKPMVKTLGHQCGDSRYTKLLKLASSPPYPLQNDGISSSISGIYLTTDLCPSSKKGYEHRLYRYIIENFPNPIPVTIFVTKRWIDKHPDSMRELEKYNADLNLSITWGNHTAYHHYHPNVPIRKNFVLSPDENLTKELKF